MKRLLAVVLIVLIGVSFTVADEVRGKVKSIDVQKRSVTLTVDDKDRTYEGTAGVKVVTSLRGKLKDVAGGLGTLKPGDVVTLTIQKVDDQIVITQVLLDTPKIKK
jgi:Cu/Ag efflux protein CusF